MNKNKEWLRRTLLLRSPDFPFISPPSTYFAGLQTFSPTTVTGSGNYAKNKERRLRRQSETGLTRHIGHKATLTTMPRQSRSAARKHI